MTLKVLVLATAAALTAGAALAQPAGGPRGMFARADANNDGFISRDEARAQRALAFDRMDANKDGFVVTAELPRRPGGDRRGGGRGDIFARFDANNDGRVSRDEFASGNQQAFDRLDANKDGVVTGDEVQTLAARARGEAQQRILAALDANRDGRVARDEYINADRERFDRMDANKDGRISREEAAEAARAMRNRAGGPGRQGS
jgi:Ca2+-binding EF-hand superfamily protein